MTKREEVAAELAEDVGAKVTGSCWQVRMPLTTDEWLYVPSTVRDALISREMRVRQLEAVLRFFEDEAISSHPAEFVNSWTAKAFSEKVRLALNSKGEKG